MTAISPWLGREKQARFALSTVALRRYPLVDALAEAAGLGFDVIDLAGLRGLCEHVPAEGSSAALRDVAETVMRSGLRVVSVNADPGSFDGQEDQRSVIDRVKRLIEFCAYSGVTKLVLPAGEKTKKDTTAPRLDELAEGINSAADIARDSDVELAVEAPYFGRPVNTLKRAGELASLIEPEVGIAFDVSHVAAAGESVTDGFIALADRVSVVHLRDAVLGDIRRPIGHGGIDFEALIRTAGEQSYEGDFVLELETRPGYFDSKNDEIRHSSALISRASGVSV